MDEDTIQRLAKIGAELRARALELSQPGQYGDTAMLMAGLAATMDAVRSIGETVNQMNGPKGLGAAGD